MKIIKKTGSNWLEKIGYSKKILVNENDVNKKGFLIQEDPSPEVL